MYEKYLEDEKRYRFYQKKVLSLNHKTRVYFLTSMENKDIRWEQRFDNYRKALTRLKQAVEIMRVSNEWEEDVDDLLKEGLIQRFEYTHELAWKVMKDYAEYQGYTDIRGSRDAFRKALEMGLIADARWMASISDRNLTSHNYDDETAEEIYKSIVHVYYPLFVQFEQTMLQILSNQ